MVIAWEDKRVGARFEGDDVVVHVDRDGLVVAPRPMELRSWIIHDPSSPPTDIPVHIQRVEASDVGSLSSPYVVWFDEAALVLPLEFRPWRHGDRMQPAGMSGTKLVSDILIDAKVPMHRKPQVYVLADHDRIVWCCGLRMAEGTKADQATSRVLRCTLVV